MVTNKLENNENRIKGFSNGAKGSVTQIIGPIVDVYFDKKVPAIRTALYVKNKAGKNIVLEVAQHIGENKVRTIAMSDTAELFREAEVTDTGLPISVPVGEVVLGRLLNLLGETIDGGKQIP